MPRDLTASDQITTGILDSMKSQLQAQASQKGINLRTRSAKRSRSNSMADDNSENSEQLKELLTLQNSLTNKETRGPVALEEMIGKLLTYLITNVSPKLEESLRISKEVVRVNEIVAQDVETLKNEVTDLKREVLNNQIQTSAKSVIIRELPPLNTSGRESPFEVKKQVEKMLTEIGIREETNIVDVYRLRGGKTVEYSGKSIFLPVKVTFNSKFDLGLLFKNLKKLKDFRSIKVARDYPRLMLEDHKKLDKAAWKIRQDFPGTKTNIRIKDSKLALFVKRPNEDFQEADINWDIYKSVLVWKIVYKKIK